MANRDMPFYSIHTLEAFEEALRDISDITSVSDDVDTLFEEEHLEHDCPELEMRLNDRHLAV